MLILAAVVVLAGANCLGGKVQAEDRDLPSPSEGRGKLEQNRPATVGADLEAFIKAEQLFAEDKFVKAVKGYERFLDEYPESEFYETALERQFAIASAFLAGRKKKVLGIFKIKGYAEGEKIMERISEKAGDAPIGIKAAVAIAESLQKRSKFAEAYYKWSEIHSRWPSGETGKESLLAMARCKLAAYKGPRYDASSLVSAKSYYENFKLRYPEDAKQIDVDGKLKQINEQLARKQFGIGRYYQRTANMQSANLYYQMVVDDWPESAAAKEIRGKK